MQSSATIDHSRSGWGWTLAMAAILLCGGGDWTVPAPRLAAQLVAAAMLACAIGSKSRRGLPPLGGIDWIAAALIGLFVLHLLPLPPAIWTALPGRELAREIETAAFGTPRWRALTLDSEATWRSLLALLPAIAIYVVVRLADARRLAALLRGVVIAAGAAIVLAAIQRALPEAGWAWPYPGGGRDQPYGYFASRNHHATFLLATLPLAAAWLWLRTAPSVPDAETDWLLVFIAFLAGVGVLATGSRTGAVLLPLALAGTAIAWLGARGMRGREMHKALASGGLLLLGAAALVLALGGDRLAGALERGGPGGDQRFEFWPLVAKAAQAYWPTGSGIGTFLGAYRAQEPFEALRQLPLNHAHSDYLEIALEAGLPGLLLALAGVGTLAVAGWRVWRGGTGGHGGDLPDRLLVAHRLAVVAAAIPVLHSAVDYPLRTVSVSCLLAMAAAMLCPSRR